VLGADHLDDQLAVPRLVELEHEDPLLLTEVQVPISQRDRLAGGEQEVLAARVSVGALSGCMLTVRMLKSLWP